MRFLLGVCAAMITLPMWANTQLTTQIHDIDHGDHITEEALVFLTSGQVVKLNVNNTDLLNQMNDHLVKREWINVTFDDNREIVEVTAAPEKKAGFSKSLVNPEVKSILDGDNLMKGYTASVLTEEKAKAIHKESRHASKEETQCFNRAHVWSYEWRVKHNIYSKKMWIFFTRKYIRRYNFEWWFHVAPMVNMIVDGQVKERVMDKKYSSRPQPIQVWANMFLRDDAKCPFVSRYSEHATLPEQGSCFFQKSPMYYYQPVDLEFFEKYGNPKLSWVENDVRMAYAEAFEIFP